jgi:hypothetical protein
MNARRVRIAGALSIVALGWTLAGCGSATSPVAPAAPVAQASDGLQPPGRQGEIAPPNVPGTPQVPPAGGSGSGTDSGRIPGE